MAVPEPVTPVREALELASRVVVMVQRADQRSGGLINRPLLRAVGELAQALGRLGIAPPNIIENRHERRG